MVFFITFADMAYTPEETQEKFDAILQDIEDGNSLRKALGFYNLSSKTFFEWLNNEMFPERVKQYACACEARSDKIFDEILEIADKQGEDVIEVDGIVSINHNIINRSRLQVDARKWALSKMNPKKYGDKIDHTTGGEKINTTPPVIQVEILKNED